MQLHFIPAKEKLIPFPVMYIPGFASSAVSLREMADMLSGNADLYLLDLPGFGNTCESIPEDYTFDRFLLDLDALLSREFTQKFVIGGYSMGGRIALQYALRHTGKLNGLILESSSSGITDPAERAQRKISDEQLAAYILSHTPREFAVYWTNQPIFGSLKNLDEEKQKSNFNEKAACSREALLVSLKLFGQGVMEPVSGQLHTLDVQTLLMTGELDEKYRMKNEEMSQLIPRCKHYSIPACGHNIHLEKTSEFVNLVLSFLNQLKETT